MFIQNNKTVAYTVYAYEYAYTVHMMTLHRMTFIICNVI